MTLVEEIGREMICNPHIGSRHLFRGYEEQQHCIALPRSNLLEKIASTYCLGPFDGICSVADFEFNCVIFDIVSGPKGHGRINKSRTHTVQPRVSDLSVAKHKLQAILRLVD